MRVPSASAVHRRAPAPAPATQASRAPATMRGSPEVSFLRAVRGSAGARGALRLSGRCGAGPDPGARRRAGREAGTPAMRNPARRRMISYAPALLYPSRIPSGHVVQAPGCAAIRIEGRGKMLRVRIVAKPPARRLRREHGVQPSVGIPFDPGSGMVRRLMSHFVSYTCTECPCAAGTILILTCRKRLLARDGVGRGKRKGRCWRIAR